MPLRSPIQTMQPHRVRVQYPKPRRKRRQPTMMSSLSSRFDDGCGDGGDGDGGGSLHDVNNDSTVVAVAASRPSVSIIRKNFPSLLFVSIALPCILFIDGNCNNRAATTSSTGRIMAFVEAVDPPTVPSSARRTRGQQQQQQQQPPSLGGEENRNIDRSSEALDNDQQQPLQTTQHSADKDSVTTFGENENIYPGRNINNNEDPVTPPSSSSSSTTYESKVQKQKPEQSLPSAARKQRINNKNIRKKSRQQNDEDQQEHQKQQHPQDQILEPPQTATVVSKEENVRDQQQPTTSQSQSFSSSATISQRQSEYDAYMHWCEKVLGIQSKVEIREFDYLDHLQLYWEGNYYCRQQEDEEDFYDDYSEGGFEWLEQYSSSLSNNGMDGGQVGEEEYLQEEIEKEKEAELLPTRTIRGLAAKQPIQPGEIVISIPLYSLLSIPTTIDHDPVLSRILGPSARKTYGWTEISEYELPLLTLAILYHRSLGKDSPISHYMDVLEGTDVEMFPFLWSDGELRKKTAALGKGSGGAGDEIKRLVRGIRRDLHDMYDDVMGTLVRERPEWFAPPSSSKDQQPQSGGVVGEEEGDEWIYSYENFQWAFALVISRHHYLPISDFDDDDDDDAIGTIKQQPSVKTADTPSQNQETLSTVSEVVPPANQPTDSWVDLAKNEERVVEDDSIILGTSSTDDDVMMTMPGSLPTKHSFLAPLADLINFGPPCLTGSYNEEEHVFELIATCPFAKGQEVTFWYSSDCSDVIIANFGFLHPLVPPCDTTMPEEEDWEKKSDEWREKAEMHERELWETYRQLDMLKDELAIVESQLVSCGCDEDGERKQQQQQQRQDDYSTMPTANHSTEDSNHKLRTGHAQHPSPSRHDIGVRGRLHHELDQQEATKEMMEELG